MRVTAVESTELFVGTPERPLQVVAAGIEHLPGRSVHVTMLFASRSARSAFLKKSFTGLRSM